jgi:transposase
VIQVHAVDVSGRRLVARAFKREQFFALCTKLPAGCVVAMEACSSAHHWARKLREQGLEPQLIAAHFVTPYRMEGKGGKNDATDAAAICEAARALPEMAAEIAQRHGVEAFHVYGDLTRPAAVQSR